jgi:hypothetical protein
MNKITNAWFYASPPFWMRFFLIYVNGDMFILLPLSILIIMVIFINIKLGLFVAAVYFTLRNAGEIFYWFLQQFGSKTYRPYDFGLTKLDNNALYIIYQTFALSMTTVGVFLIYIITSYIKFP